MPLPQWLSPKEFAARWNLSVWAVYRGIRRGEIPARRIGDQLRIAVSWEPPSANNAKDAHTCSQTPSGVSGRGAA